ncbi:mucin-4 [Anolis sagrei]|uniref:mucin-4 n=1 Tax=Anolis sagrei TaxID=38937 RepID=UPI003521F79E
MLWTFLCLWVCLLCEPGLTAAIPVATDWPDTDADGFTDDYLLSWGTSSDYFDPTMASTTEGPFTIQSTVPTSEAEENPGAVTEENTSNPPEGEMQNSGLASKVDSATKATNQVEIPPPGEEIEGAAEVPVMEKEASAKGNSSKTSSEKGTVQATPRIPGSVEVLPSSLSYDGPETTELLSDVAAITDSSFVPASANEDGLGKKTMDATTGETSQDSELNPTLASWKDTPGEEEETPQAFPDANSEAVAPLSTPHAPFPEEQPMEEPEVTPANDEHLVPPTSGDGNAEEEPSPSLPPLDLLPPRNIPVGSSELSENATVSSQPSSSSEDNPGVESTIGDGRGDSDASISVPVLGSEAEPTIIPSWEEPEMGPESPTGVTPEESEDLNGAEASNSPPADGTADLLPTVSYPNDLSSRPSDLGYDATPAPPIGLSMPPGYSSLLPEDDEMQTVSVTKEETEEGSGTPSNNEIPFTLTSSQQEEGTEIPEEGISATEVPKGDDSVGLGSGTASPLKPGEETTSSELAGNEQYATSDGAAIQSEITPFSSEMTPSNSAEVAGEELEGLKDMEATSPSAPEDEAAVNDQEAAGETVFTTSQSGVSSEGQGEENSGNGGPLSDESTAVPEPGATSGSASNEEGESRTDSPPSDGELDSTEGTTLPVGGSGSLENGESSSPSPVENAVASDSASTEAPSSSSPGSPDASQSEDNMQADLEATDVSEEPEGSVEEEVSSATDTGSATDGATFSGTSGETVPSGDSASESEANKGTISESNSPEEINTPSSELAPTSEKGMATNSDITDDGSGDFSTFIAGSGSSTKDGGLSDETSPTLLDGSSSESFTSEAEEGDDSPSPPLGDVGSSSGSEVPGDNKSGEDNTGLLANEGAVTNSGESQTTADTSDTELSGGADLPAGQSEAMANGAMSDQPFSEEGEASGTNSYSGEEFSSAPASLAKDGETSATSVASGEDSPSSSGLQIPDPNQPSPDNALKSEPVASSEAGKEVSLDPSTTKSQTALPTTEGLGSAGSSLEDDEQPQQSPDNTASEGASQELEDSSSVDGKVATLDPSSAESQKLLPPTERLGSAGSSLEDGEEPTLSPDDAAPEGAEQSEESSKVKEEETSMAPSDTVSQAASDRVETNASLVGENEGPQLSPDDTWEMGPKSTSEAETEPKDISVIGGMKPSSTEGVETSFSGTAVESQPSSDGITSSDTEAGLGAFDEVEQWEGSSPVNEDEIPSELSSTELPGTSGAEDTLGGAGNVKPSLSAEEAEVSPSVSADGKGSQQSLNGATEGPGDSGGVKISDGSSSLSGTLSAESSSPSVEGMDSASEGSGNDGGSQPSLDGAEPEQPSISSSISGKESSLTLQGTEAQPGSSSPDGIQNDGLSTSGSPASASEEAQLPPEYADRAGAEAGEESGDVSATRSPLTSLSKEEVGDSVLGLGSSVGSQTSPDAAEATATEPGASEEVEQWGSSSAAREEDIIPSDSSATKSLGTSPDEELINNVESQASGAPAAGTSASGEEEEPEDTSNTNGKELSLSPSDIGSESLRTSAGEEVSGGLSEEKTNPAAGLDSMGTKSTSSSETGQNPESIVNLGETSGSMNDGEPLSQSSPAGDGSVAAVVNKAPGENLLSGSTSPDEAVATQGTPGQIPGIRDSSLTPSPMTEVDTESLAGVMGSDTGASNTIGTSLQSSESGGTKMATDQESGMASSPSTALSSSDTQPLGSYDSENTGNVAGEPSSQDQAGEAVLVGKEPGEVDSSPTDLGIQGAGPSLNGLASSSDEASVGNTKDVSPTTSEVRGDTVSASEKGIIKTASNEAQPSPSGTTLCPATMSPLPAVESGPEVNAGMSSQSSKAGVPEGPGDTLSGKPSASSDSISLGSDTTKSGSMSGSSASLLPDSSVQKEATAVVSKDTTGGTKTSSPSKSDPSLVGSGVGLDSTKSTKPSSMTSKKKEEGKLPEKGGESKTSGKKEDSKKVDKEDSKKADKVTIKADKEDSKKADKDSKTSEEDDSKKSDKKEIKKLDKDSKKSDKKDAKKSDKEDSKKSDEKEDSKKPDNKPDSSSSNSKITMTANDRSATLNPVPVASLSASLFPYGPMAKDKEYVERKLNFNSPLFKPEIGVPLGLTLRDSLYFTDNGQIIFPVSETDISSSPNAPLGGFNGREAKPMVAVFWDNADFSKGSGTIFYQEYVTQNSAKHPLVRDVEAMVQQYLASSYSARWTLKITWVKAQHYPAQKLSSRTNTYQAILTTDGYRTYTLFLYQAGGMQWDYTKLSSKNVLVGYTSGDGFFRNDDLMSQLPAVKYRPDRVPGYNTGVRGMWLYKLDSRIRVNYRQRCLDWLSNEKQPLAWNKDLPPCPCSLSQGLSDGHFTLSKKGLLESHFTMLYSSAPNKYGSGVRCLYKNDGGQLVDGHQERIWKASRKSSPFMDEELKLYDWCCNRTGKPLFCDKYHQKRPKIGCDGYKPPVQATSSEEEPNSNERGKPSDPSLGNLSLPYWDEAPTLGSKLRYG